MNNYNVTNTHNLPRPYYDAIRLLSEVYSKGEGVDFSTTELIGPACQGALKRQAKRSGKQLTVDCKGLHYAMIGSAKHYFFEALDKLDNYECEVRRTATMDGKVISGAVDVYQKDTATIWDFKETFKNTLKEGPKPEWEAQLNINAWIMHHHGIEVRNVIIAPLYRDYRVMNPSDLPTEHVHCTLWPLEQTEAYIKERIAAHVAADEKLTECSFEERWAKPEQWAVKTESTGTTLRPGLYNTQEEAQERVDNHKKPASLFIEHRKAQNTRCENMCDVAQICPFHQARTQNN